MRVFHIVFVCELDGGLLVCHVSCIPESEDNFQDYFLPCWNPVIELMPSGLQIKYFSPLSNFTGLLRKNAICEQHSFQISNTGEAVRTAAYQQ